MCPCYNSQRDPGPGVCGDRRVNTTAVGNWKERTVAARPLAPSHKSAFRSFSSPGYDACSGRGLIWETTSHPIPTPRAQLGSSLFFLLFFCP